MLVIAVSVAALPAADHVSGKSGGVLVIGQTSEPKTFNPAMAVDQGTRDVLSVLSADLVHINRLTLRTELALAKGCVMSADGRHYTVTLRDGLRFSDGAPVTADDVLFSFKVYLDERVNSPQRDLLIVDGKPVAVTKLSALSVRVDLPAPYAPGERLFDRSGFCRSTNSSPRSSLENFRRPGRLERQSTNWWPPVRFESNSISPDNV